jgi:hypothetical protein
LLPTAIGIFESADDRLETDIRVVLNLGGKLQQELSR